MVIERGMDAEYFLQMPIWLALQHLASIHYTDRVSWEQTREVVWAIAQVNSSKQLKRESIMKFPWDESNETKNITEEDTERIKAKAKAMENILNNRDNG